MTFEEYLKEVADARRTIPHWRCGQTYFNILSNIKPTLAEEIRGSFRDPFYQDYRITSFLCFVEENWSSYK